MKNPTIEQLQADHFEEALDFINMVFSLASRPTDFKVILPDLYQPTDEHMSAHHVIRERGRIKALVGIYPGHYVVGRTKLSMARIGAVSTHPDARMKGYMSALMDHVRSVIRIARYDIAYLGGARHRYLPFGFEKCGHQPVFQVTKRSLERGIRTSDRLTLFPCENDAERIDTLHELYERQTFYFKRDRKAFYRIAHHWYNTPFQIELGGRSVGYLIASKDRKRIEEIVCEEGVDVTAVIHAYFEAHEVDACRIVVHPLAPRMMQRIFTVSESVSIHDRDNWSILAFERVLRTLMRAKHDVLPLLEGRMVIEIVDRDRYEIAVSSQGITVERTERTPDISVSDPDAHRLFFGPLHPHRVIEIPSRLAFIEQWFPLPLFLSSPDFA
ncbi:MAG: GNAT family N-acetyltransferase [Acholeplasmataceae bacterium]